jgi:hypothetical protein
VKNFPPISTTPAANFATSFSSVVITGGKYATGVNDTGANLPPVSTTLWQIVIGINDTGGKFATGVSDTGGKQ